MRRWCLRGQRSHADAADAREDDSAAEAGDGEQDRAPGMEEFKASS